MEPFPYTIHAQHPMPAAEEINEMLLKHGAILFRGYPLQSKTDFANFVLKLTPAETLLDYTGGTSPRHSLGDGVYTSTKMPFFLKIPMHSEMSYRHRFPGKVFFFCEKAPLVGGETPVVDIRKVYASIPQALKLKIESQGIIYYRHLKNYTRLKKFLAKINPMIETGTWQYVFKTLDPKVVENYCRENKYISKWQDDGSVILETHLPAILHHPKSLEKSWFNSIHFFQVHHRIWGRLITSLYKILLRLSSARDLSARTEKGEKLSSVEVSAIMDAYDQHTKKFSWQEGDVLYLDNTLTAHGRNPYFGKRKILVCLAEEFSF